MHKKERDKKFAALPGDITAGRTYHPTEARGIFLSVAVPQRGNVIKSTKKDVILRHLCRRISRFD